MKVQNIFDFLNTLFPVSDANDYDNPGLLVGEPEREVKRALIALDCTLETVNEAVKKQCDVIITHHPVIFSPLRNVLAGTVVYELLRNSISVISMHTNLDVGENGVNDRLCREIGLENIKPHTAADGYLLKWGTVLPIGAESFATLLKAKLGGCIKFVDGGKPIKKVLVCSGSGGDFVQEAISFGFDALVTADIKHHHFLTALDNGISLFDAGHYNTEDIIVEPLREMLQKEFSNCEFLTHHPNKFKFV